MKISVIITVYNLEKYIREAIESVLNQTLKPDEIIIVNDGSSDGSHRIIEEYAEEIIYIRKKKNEGVLPAIISAIALSTGDIVMFLDGDDIWEKTKIKKTAQIFEELPDVMLVTHNYKWIDKVSQVLNMVDATHRNLKKIGGSTLKNYKRKSEFLKESVLTYRGVWLGSAFSIRRELLDLSVFVSFLKEFNEDYLRYSHQDQPLAAYLIAQHPDKHLYFIDQVLFYYRVYGENTSGNTRDKKAALATLKRSQATVAYTSHILKTFMSSRIEAIKSQKAHLYYFAYLNDLYNNRMWQAFRNLTKASHALSLRNTLKELVRILIVIIAGSNFFFKVK